MTKVNNGTETIGIKGNDVHAMKLVCKTLTLIASAREMVRDNVQLWIRIHTYCVTYRLRDGGHKGQMGVAF